MPDGSEVRTVKVAGEIGNIAAADWDACAGTADPFVSHAFLSALEDSGAAGAEAGWMPHHLTAEDAAGRIIGCAPLYLKSHSYGEYVFDWGWADAYERAGGRYYPKLQCAVPFTPVTGRRLLVRDGAPADTAELLVRAMVRLGEQSGVSSLHITFPTEAEWQRLGALGLVNRIGEQYHWFNRGYGRFEDFLGDLQSRKRKTIRKERQVVSDSEVMVRTLVGSEIAERHWDAFHRFYRNTHDRKWGYAYLNRPFFSLLGERLGDRVVLVYVEDAAGRPVAGALNLRGDGALFGRYWGCAEAFKFLHFEACYYRAIDFAIATGLSRVEAGAQGPHKVQRGYRPVRTFSVHWIANPGLRAAVERFVSGERQAVEADIARLEAELPFRQDAGRC